MCAEYGLGFRPRCGCKPTGTHRVEVARSNPDRSEELSARGDHHLLVSRIRADLGERRFRLRIVVVTQVNGGVIPICCGRSSISQQRSEAFHTIRAEHLTTYRGSIIGLEAIGLCPAGARQDPAAERLRGPRGPGAGALDHGPLACGQWPIECDAESVLPDCHDSEYPKRTGHLALASLRRIASTNSCRLSAASPLSSF